MSMIGLFTTAPQAVGTAAANEDSAAAAGFGTALQGVLDALTGDAEKAASLGEAAETPSLGELVETASLGETVESPSSNPLPASTGSTGVPVEPSTGNAVPVPTAESDAGLPAATTPLVGLGPTLPVTDDSPESEIRVAGSEPRSSSPMPVSTTSTGVPVETRSAGFVEAVQSSPSLVSTGSTGIPVGTTTGNPVPVSTSSISAPVEPTTDLPLPVSTNSTGLPAATPTSHPASANAADVPVVDTAPRSPLPVSTGPSSAPVETPLTTPRAASTAAAATAPTTPVSVHSADVTAASSAPAVAASAVTAPQSATPVAPAAPSPASVPFAAQLARPIFSLAAAGHGEHIMTVSVTPDTLGPVTVRAHVGTDGVRVELFAPNDAGRDAIRAILPELRRDLAGAGLGGNLSLSTQNTAPAHADGDQFGAGHGPRDQAAERGGSRPGPDIEGGRDRQNADTPLAQQPARPGLFGTASTIDVLA